MFLWEIYLLTGGLVLQKAIFKTLQIALAQQHRRIADLLRTMLSRIKLLADFKTETLLGLEIALNA